MRAVGMAAVLFASGCVIDLSSFDDAPWEHGWEADAACDLDVEVVGGVKLEGDRISADFEYTPGDGCDGGGWDGGYEVSIGDDRSSGGVVIVGMSVTDHHVRPGERGRGTVECEVVVEGSGTCGCELDMWNGMGLVTSHFVGFEVR